MALIWAKSIHNLFGFRNELPKNLRANPRRVTYFCHFHGVTGDFTASDQHGLTGHAEISDAKIRAVVLHFQRDFSAFERLKIYFAMGPTQKA